MRPTLALSALLVTVGCSSSADHAGDASADAYPTAAHTPYPQVPDQGGPRLAHPQLVTVTFANDPRAATFEAYAQWIVGSSWLVAVGADFGVGPGAIAGVAHRPETPPATITSGDIEAYLAAGVTDGSIPKPASLADALYIVYYPQTTSITTTFVNGIIKHSCSDFGGYHGEVHQGGLDFAYAAIPTCGGAVQGLTADETIEMIVSHELIEAATDAMPITAPAWQLRADPTDAWFGAFEFEVEVGDLCEEPTRYTRENNFPVQRSWSNAAAAAGREPCIPVDPSLPAFGVTLAPAGTQHVAAGATLDLTVTGWATGPVADWQLSADVWSNTGPTSSRIKVMFDAPTLHNSATTTMHVIVPSTVAAGTERSIFVLSSHTTEDTTTWPLAIVVP